MRTPHEQVFPDHLSARSLRLLLENHERWDWTWQGFGMVRMYLDPAKRYRLNIWDERSKVPRVSLIHDHPWSFRSAIYCGEIVNQRYNCEELYGDRREPALGGPPQTHWMKRIVTGEAGHDVTAGPIPVCLRRVGRETYGPGFTYAQALDEVHETAAKIGTVTLNDRTEPTAEYSARVFWHKAEPTWVAAKPRPAAPFEVKRAVASALAQWPTEPLVFA